MILTLNDLRSHVVTDNPEIIYLTDLEFCNVMDDPAVLQFISWKEPSFSHFMGRPILLRPAVK